MPSDLESYINGRRRLEIGSGGFVQIDMKYMNFWRIPVLILPECSSSAKVRSSHNIRCIGLPTVMHNWERYLDKRTWRQEMLWNKCHVLLYRECWGVIKCYGLALGCIKAVAQA